MTTSRKCWDADGTVLLCLHQWGAHEHPHPEQPRPRRLPGMDYCFFFRVDDFDEALAEGSFSLSAHWSRSPS